MLAYPFTFYAVNGVAILLRQVSQKRLGSTMFAGFRSKVSAMVLATVMLGAVFLATPFLMVNVGFGIYSLFPICRYFCSSPAVPYQDIDGTVEAVQWLADNMQDDAVAVLQNAFVTWAKLHLETAHNVIGYVNDVDLAVDLALQSGYEHTYFVCWNEDVGWYGVYVPEGFVEVQSFCRISVYEYVG